MYGYYIRLFAEIVDLSGRGWYNSCVAASDTRYGKEVFYVEMLLSLLIAVMAGVISHLICKWLDSDK